MATTVNNHEIEASAHIKSAVDSLRKSARSGYNWEHDGLLSCEETMLGPVVNKVWDTILAEIKGYDFSRPAVSGEMAMAEIMRRGVKKEDIRIRHNSFTFRLQNSEYRIYKEISGFTSGACRVGGSGNSTMHAIGLSAESFADFIYFFDSIIPEIKAAVDELMKEFEAIIIAKKKERLAKDLVQTTIKSLEEQYLRPLGISVNAFVRDDKVSLSLRQNRRASVETTLDKIPEILSDISRIQEILKPVKESAEDSIHGFRLPHIIGMDEFPDLTSSFIDDASL